MNKNVTGSRWVTESALIERINERLTDDSRNLKDQQMEGSPSIGHFYEQPNETGRPGSIDLEAMGRELGVLALDESVARDSD
jgi:hypothetical protein